MYSNRWADCQVVSDQCESCEVDEVIEDGGGGGGIRKKSKH